MSSRRGSQAAQRVQDFGTSVFTEMTLLARECGAINLAQGFPDFDGPLEVQAAALEALRSGDNQYAVSYGQPDLRAAIAEHALRFYGQQVDGSHEVTVVSGATEGIFAAVQALVDPGDEVIVFEPYYDSYAPSVVMAGGIVRSVALQPPAWNFDPQELARAFNARTRLILVNTPHNPTGKVFTRAELEMIASLCLQWDVLAISDEIYERIVYDARPHVSIASLPGMANRTVVTSGLSKTYSVTGWRIGWAIAPAALTGGIRKIHDFLTVAAPTPFMDAGVVALSMPAESYRALAADYQARRDLMLDILGRHGFATYQPGGAYYVMVDVAKFGFSSDTEFALHLVKDIGVATVPGSSFYSDPASAPQTVRFCFSKRTETLQEADRRLAALSR